MKISPLKFAAASTKAESAAQPARFTPAAVQAHPHHGPKGRVLRLWFVINNTVVSFINNNDLLWAAALTYTVALSIIPVLALAFSVLKAFGSAEQLRPLIQNYVALGSEATTDQIMAFVNNVNAKALGSLGAISLVITVISTMGTVEQAFNNIFRVPKSRGYLRKFTDYLSVLLTVPLFITAGLAATAVLSVEITRVPDIAAVAPYLFAWSGFFLLFIFFPYTKVDWRSALIGSLFTAILFQLAQWGYINFQVGAARYRAIYGAVATIPIFLVWVYVAWIIVLAGAELTAALQRGVPAFMMEARSPDFPRAIALYSMMRLAEHHLHGGAEVTYEGVAGELGTAMEAVEPVLDRLKEAGLIVEQIGEKRARFRRVLLCRAPSVITLDQILAAAVPEASDEVADPRIRLVLKSIHEAARDVLKPVTLSDLLNSAEESPG